MAVSKKQMRKSGIFNVEFMETLIDATLFLDVVVPFLYTFLVSV